MKKSNGCVRLLPGAVVMAILWLVLTCFSGCVTSHARRTIGDEIVEKYGSLEIAIEQPWEARAVGWSRRPRVLLSHSQKTDLMYAIKDCYVWERPKGDFENSIGGCSSDGIYRLCVGPVPNERFSFYVIDDGFLVGYLCPSPYDVVEVHRKLKAIFSDATDIGSCYLPKQGNDTADESELKEDDLF